MELVLSYHPIWKTLCLDDCPRLCAITCVWLRRLWQTAIFIVKHLILCSLFLNLSYLPYHQNCINFFQRSSCFFSSVQSGISCIAQILRKCCVNFDVVTMSSMSTMRKTKNRRQIMSSETDVAPKPTI